MSCCSCPHSRSAGKLFGKAARRYRRRFEKKGLEKSQRQLLALLAKAGFEGRTVMEIGCGVGHFHQTMLEQGAISAFGIDLSEDMVAEARQFAGDRGLAERTRYQAGDVMEMDIQSRHDIVVMDKVLCCYPDAIGLLGKSNDIGNESVGFTLPKYRWYTRLGEKLGILFFNLIRQDFRPYVHDVDQLDRLMQRFGFKRVGEDQTLLWLSRVYSRTA